MPRQTFGQSCCTTTPTAMWLWGATFVILYGTGALLRETLPGFRPYGDTVTLVALAAACFVNFGRNRTLHCGITGPLFVAAAIVALLGEAGVWNVDENILWGVVLAGVLLAFIAEWRLAGARTALPMRERHMDAREPETLKLADEVKAAIGADDAARVRAILDDHPQLKALINEPVGPFDSPAITNVCSREMLDVLLDAGADINARSRWWAGGFGLMDSAGPELAAYAIDRGATVNVHAAARLGMMDRLSELIAKDPSAVHARGGDGQTALHFASTIDVAAYLLDHGADIDARDVDHESTPAQYMVKERQDVARHLVSAGCHTDLLMATALGDLDLARRHLDSDPACIRMRVNDEFFPMVSHKAGGTIYQWTLGFHASAHQVARQFGRQHLLTLLFKRSPVDVRLIDACWIADEPTVRTIRQEHPAIFESLSEADRRQVAHAARNNQSAAVRLMLECGWPVDARGQHQATPLHWAAFHGNAEMAETILRFGPPLEATDADFNGTPLRWAIYGSEHGWYCRTGDYGATAESLIRAGAERPSIIEGSAVVQDVLRRFAA